MTERTDSLKSDNFVKCATCRSMGMGSCCNFRSDHYGHKIETFHPACTEYNEKFDHNRDIFLTKQELNHV